MNRRSHRRTTACRSLIGRKAGGAGCLAAAVAGVLVLGVSSRAGEAAPPRLAPAAPETKARLGTNELVGTRPLRYRALLTPYAKAQVAGLGQQVPWISAVLILPEDWKDRPSIALFIVCSPSGSPSIAMMGGYTNAALAEGWAVLAADGPRIPPDKDTVMWNWGVLESALAYLHQCLPRSRAWPLALGGFSGGAKCAAAVAAAAMQARYTVRGVFMGGCNEDRATTGALLFSAGPRFADVPFFLSNGNADPIANPAHAMGVQASLQRGGFHKIRLESYAGGHGLHPEHVRVALRWFADNAPPGSPDRR